jgi:hypothetical protein
MISFKSISEIKNLISQNNNNIHEILESVIDELESTGKSLDALKFTDKDFAISQANHLILILKIQHIHLKQYLGYYDL